MWPTLLVHHFTDTGTEVQRHICALGNGRTRIQIQTVWLQNESLPHAAFLDELTGPEGWSSGCCSNLQRVAVELPLILWVSLRDLPQNIVWPIFYAGTQNCQPPYSWGSLALEMQRKRLSLPYVGVFL